MLVQYRRYKQLGNKHTENVVNKGTCDFFLVSAILLYINQGQQLTKIVIIVEENQLAFLFFLPVCSHFTETT